MTKTTKSQVRKAVSILFSFFLSLFLFFSALILVAQNTLLNPNYLRNQLGKSHYYENVTEEVEDEFSSYASASGFDDQFFKTVLNINDVQLKVNESLSIVYGDSGGTMNVTDFQNTLYDLLVQNAKDRGIAVTKDSEQALRLLAKTCADTYLQYVSFPFAQEISSFLPKVGHSLFLLQALSVFFIALFAGLIFLINYWRHRAVRACIYSVSGAVLMLTAFPLLFLISGTAGRIALISRSLYGLAVSYLDGIAFLLLQVALLYAVLLALLVLLYRHLLKRARGG